MRLPALALALGMLLSGCGGGDDDGGPAAHVHGEGGAGFEAGDADTTVDVEMKDYAFVGVPSTVQGPKVFFQAETTAGEHELIVLRGSEELGSVHPPPRGKGDLAVELTPGDYVLVCRIKEGPKNHEELGMRQSFSVR